MKLGARAKESKNFLKNPTVKNLERILTGSEIEEMMIEQQPVDVEVEEMGVCWEGYRRNSKPRYSKGSCVKVKRRRGRRRRKFKQELKF